MREARNPRFGVATAVLLVAVMVALAAAPSVAVVIPGEDDPLREHEFWHPDLLYGNVVRPVAELPLDTARALGSELSRLGVDPGHAYFDLRSGRWGTLLLAEPMIPGSGVGNSLRWSSLGYEAAPQGEALEQAVWDRFRGYLIEHAAELRIDPQELGDSKVTVLGDRLIQIHAGRSIDGVPVRDTFVNGSINSGNLVLWGQHNWAPVEVNVTPRLSRGDARAAVQAHVEGFPITGLREDPHLELIPTSSQPAEAATFLGAGIEYRLAWVLKPEFERDLGSWEAVVDAHDGELLSFVDTNHYASRRVEGGIFPVSNDGDGDDGTLQFGYPMPFADVTLDGVDVGVTTVGGNAPTGSDAGTLATALEGPFARMNDNCGAVDESVAAGDLDLDGVPLPGTDCDVPADHSAGDTNASRTGFYELNRLMEQARGYLPTNSWLQQQLTANMNINLNCNAFWNGSTINFYTSGGGCANTGEIAAVFDHEWGHGMDDNDANPTVSRPGEGIADIFAIYRLNDSCVGRGFRPGVNCGGFGDPCLDCTGVRDVDWEKHQSGQPHGADYAVACPPPTGGIGPCGRVTHCEGHLVSEMAFDLVHRDLAAAPYNLDLNTALELGTRLAYFGSSNVFNWYQCDFPDPDSIDGCNSDSGYLGYLAADDDNGDITDGTPHMSAIFAAFDRHDIACPAPTVQDSGCADTPSAPTNLSADTFDEGMELSWDPVVGASEYRIFRTEGVHGCDFGKAQVGTETDTTFSESGLRNGFEVLYSVVAVGANDACASPMSECLSVTPTAGPSGFIEGTVIDADTLQPIENAAVEAVGPVTVSDATDENGEYSILAPVGTYDVTADHEDYDPETVTDVAVTEGGTEIVDFELTLTPVPIADISPESFTFEVAAGNTDNDTLNIGNIGSLDLDWSIAEDEAPAPLAQPVLLEEWSDDFDDYATDSQIHGQGGWKGWFNDPAAGALVSDAQAQSTPNSVEIVGASDLVHEYVDSTSGQWVYTAWQFIPADFTGESYFIMLNSYDDSGSGLNWSTQVNFTGATDTVVNEGGSGGTLPMIRDQWVEIRVEIDLDADTQDFYYNDELLYSGTWTNEVSGGGAVNIGAVDLFANGASEVYYDDLSLVDATVPPACVDSTDIPWLSVNPETGSTPPDSNVPVDVTVDTTGLDVGEHNANLCITTNDPAAEQVQVPVTLTVFDADAPVIDVDPESLESELPAGDSETQPLTIANIGGGTLDWEVTETSELTERILWPSGPVTTPVTRELEGAVRGLARATESGDGATASHPFPVPAGGGDIVITHSSSMDIEAGNSVACANSGPPQTTVDNQFLRTFTLEDFDITSGFQVTEVVFGVENLTTNVTVAVNLYTLDGPFTYANLTPIGSTTVDLTPQSESLVTAAVSGTAPAGSTLVVEIEVPTLLGQGVYFPGSNSQGETAPSYIASDTCSLPDPTPYADIDFPDVHLVMSVTGTLDSLDCTLPTWVGVDPTSGSLPGGESQVADVTFDTAGLAPGDYSANLCLASNDAATPVVGVPLSLTVNPSGPADIEVTPESLFFQVPAGENETQVLDIANLGGEDLMWSIDEANPGLVVPVPEGAPYRYNLAETPAFNAPVGGSRASGVTRSRGEAPADRVVMPAPQAQAVGSFTEGFDDITTLPGAGWAMINNSEPVGPSSWFQGNETIFPSHEGAPDAYIAANYESAAAGGDVSNWLLTPEVTIVNGTTACFWTRTTEQFEEFYDRLEVRMSIAGDSTDVGDTADSVGDFTDLLLSINPDLVAGEYPEDWTEFCVTVRERSRQPVTGRFAFRYWVTDTNVNGDYIGIDTVSVTQPDDIPDGGCDNPVDIPWLAANPTSGTTAPGGSEPVDVSVSTGSLDPGDFEALLCIGSNDPDEPLVAVPVTLVVTEGPGIECGPDASPVTHYFSDLEADEGGWTGTGLAPWEWGEPELGVFEDCDTVPEDEPDGPFSGTNVWATNLNGCYANSGSESLLSQTFDLSAISGPVELSWWNWYEIFVSFDMAEVLVNGDLLWEVDTTTPTPDYIREVVDLSAYAGQSDVTVDFRLFSTTVVNRSGWYLDDMKIEYCEPNAVANASGEGASRR